MARNFDGVDDSVENTAVTMTDNDLTAMIWVYAETEGEGGGGTFFLLQNSAITRYILLGFEGGASVNRPVSLFHWGTERTIAGVDNDITLNTWQHWALRFTTSSNKIDIVRNGTQLATLSGDPGTDAAPTQLFVGAKSAGDSAFDGKLADFRWYEGVALTDTEIDMARRGPLMRPDKLKVWWPLWGTTSPEPDWSGNNKHGTVTGAVRDDHPPGISAIWLAPQSRLSQVAAAAAVGADGGGPRTFAAFVPGFP